MQLGFKAIPENTHKTQQNTEFRLLIGL